MEEKLTIKVTGLGHKLTLKDLPSVSTTVEGLFQAIEEQTGLPSRYQKLIGPQKLNITYNDDLITKSLADLGIKHRTKLMLLHSPNYQAEKDTYEQLQAVEQEIASLRESIQQQAQKEGYVAEMVTRICCKLDAIDTSGSPGLRAHRKKLIQTAEGLEALEAPKENEA